MLTAINRTANIASMSFRDTRRRLNTEYVTAPIPSRAVKPPKQVSSWASLDESPAFLFGIFDSITNMLVGMNGQRTPYRPSGFITTTVSLYVQSILAAMQACLLGPPRLG